MTGSEAIKTLGVKLFKDFDIDSEPRLSIYKRCYENFIEGLDEEKRNKGLLIIGQIGVGKSVMMKIMQKLFKDSVRGFKWLVCSDLVDLLEHYTPSEVKQMYGRELKMDLYIDDIGVGNSIFNKYGNTTNIISDILSERYELFVSEKIKTHVSSNKSTSLDKKLFPDIITLEDLYGIRIIDRLKEMCETIVWKGDSLRK